MSISALLSPGRRRFGYWPYVLIALVGTAAAFFEITSQFSPWDDEGYLVSSVAEFLRGGSLYDEIYTQYGPFYYVLFGGLSKVTGIDPTNDAGRVLSTVIWSAAAIVIGLLSERLAASRAVGIVAAIAAFSVPFVVKEPMHPVGICTLLVVILIAFATWGQGLYARRGAIAVGLTLGALAMIKINMGALAALGLLCAILLAAPPARWRLPCAAGAAALLLAGPAVLMSKDLDFGWAQKSLVLMLGALIAILIRAWPGGRDPAAPALARLVAWIAAGASAAIAVTCGVIIAAGTSPHDIVDGVLIDPTRHPGIDFIAIPLPRQVAFWSLAAIAVAAIARTRRRWRRGDGLEARALLRLVAASAIALAVVDTEFLGGETMLIGVPVLLAWLGARAPDEVAGKPLARLALVLVATLELLQAYPVAGSQLLGGELPLLLVAAVIAGDGLKLLALAGDRVPARSGHTRTIAGLLAVATGAVLLVWGIANPGREALSAYRENRQPDLYGMSLTRLPSDEAAGYERLTRALAGCDTYVTYPGMSSFYLWTRSQSPTRFNVANWMLLVGDRRQRRAVEHVSRIGNLCVLRNDSLAQIRLTASRFMPRGPLIDYLATTPLRDKAVAKANGFGEYRVQERAP